VISGYPCSGKTIRAHQIASDIKLRISQAEPNTRESRLRVHIVNFESLSLIRSEAYRDARTEKLARGAEYSAVKRLLSKDDIVIADGLYHIKGVRYQLFCEARAALTTNCVVHVAAPPEECRRWNSARRETPANNKDSAIAAAALGVDNSYSDELLDNLIFRYEEPNPMARWDSPCFVVPYIDELPDLQRIWDEVVVGRGVVVRANQATVLVCFPFHISRHSGYN
jgi:protein KTI12